MLPWAGPRLHILCRLSFPPPPQPSVPPHGLRCPWGYLLEASGLDFLCWKLPWSVRPVNNQAPFCSSADTDATVPAVPTRESGSAVSSVTATADDSLPC